MNLKQIAFQAKTGKAKKDLIFHPILIGAYTSVAFLASNVVQLNLILALRTILFSLIVAVTVFGVMRLIIRDPHKAGVLASLGLLLFTIYGHLYNLLENKSFLGHHSILLTTWLVIFALAVFFVWRVKRLPRFITSFLNIFSLVLIAMPVFQIISVLAQPVSKEAPANPAVDSIWHPEAAALPGSPDVYYIILDAYSRSDKLLEHYGYDNHLFLQELQNRGFYVVDCSLSNYNQTVSSLSSTLNMDYLENFAPTVVNNELDFHRLGGTIKHSQVRELFGELGYDFVSFETSYWWLDIVDADKYVTQYTSPWQQLANFKYISDFEKDYMNTTMLRAGYEVKRLYELKHGKALLSPEQAHFDMVNYSLAALENMPQTSSPKVVYAHLVAPHFPYVFSADGSFHYVEADNPGYLNEITFINQRILGIIDTLIKDSNIPPVIILQGDHGLKMEERNANLSAYYFPEAGHDIFYSTITPVNTFRLVFNTYFGADFPLLPDVARISTYQDPFDFQIYQDQCAAKPVR